MSGPLAALERYRDATAIASSPHLAERIGARLLLEPPSTAPRRFLAALRALDARGRARGLAQNAGTAFRPGTRSMLLRAQAMAIVLVTLATVGFGSVAGLAATQQVARYVVEELADRPSEGSITSPAAPAAPMVRAVEQPKVQPAGTDLVVPATSTSPAPSRPQARPVVCRTTPRPVVSRDRTGHAAQLPRTTLQATSPRPIRPRPRDPTRARLIRRPPSGPTRARPIRRPPSGPIRAPRRLPRTARRAHPTRGRPQHRRPRNDEKAIAVGTRGRVGPPARQRPKA